MLRTKLDFVKKLPSKSQFPESTILFYDSILLKKPFFKKWSQQFPYKIALKSGEKLKSIDQFKIIAEKLGRMLVPQTQDLTFVAIGGGSVGDFVGFLASVYLRGRTFIQIPSTWLAAVDSAHGGKNGLNLKGKKNQIGSFYSPVKTFLVKELLQSQPHQRLTDALGEVVKITLIGGTEKMFQAVTSNKKADLFKILPKLIQLKMNIVKKDPTEKNGQRRILNLGHTLGHIFEVSCHWSHGQAVWAGTIFALRYSYQKGFLLEKDFINMWEGLHKIDINLDYQKAIQKISTNQIRSLLVKDKKVLNKNEIDFIFIHGFGKVKRHKVTIQEIINEYQRQKREI